MLWSGLYGTAVIGLRFCGFPARKPGEVNKIKINKINICNGNRTEWSPIRSVAIRVINKNRTTARPSPIC